MHVSVNAHRTAVTLCTLNSGASASVCARRTCSFSVRDTAVDNPLFLLFFYNESNARLVIAGAACKATPTRALDAGTLYASSTIQRGKGNMLT